MAQKELPDSYFDEKKKKKASESFELVIQHVILLAIAVYHIKSSSVCRWGMDGRYWTAPSNALVGWTNSSFQPCSLIPYTHTHTGTDTHTDTDIQTPTRYLPSETITAKASYPSNSISTQRWEGDERRAVEVRRWGREGEALRVREGREAGREE